MTDQAQYLTAQGMKELEDRLEFLKTVRRAEVAERLHQALEEGGELTENAEYEDAKNQQAFVEGEIMRLDQILSMAQLIEEPTGKKKKAEIALGSRVTIQEKGQRDKEQIQIVGAAEADPSSGRISHESPMGRALINHKVGDEVTVQAPMGDLIFVVKAIN